MIDRVYAADPCATRSYVAGDPVESSEKDEDFDRYKGDGDSSHNSWHAADKESGTFTASATSSSLELKAVAKDNFGLNAPTTRMATGTAKGQKTVVYSYDEVGPPPCVAPGAKFDWLFNGEGTVTSQGNVSLGGVALGQRSGEVSARGSSEGSGSITGAGTSPSANVSNVGGTASANATGVMTGSVTVSPTGVSATGNVNPSSGPNNSTTLLQIGTWNINIQSGPMTRGDVDGPTITILSKHKVTGSVISKAQGAATGAITTTGDVEADASMDASISNLIKK